MIFNLFMLYFVLLVFKWTGNRNKATTNEKKKEKWTKYFKNFNHLSFFRKKT